jgi:hypothetical protein
MAGWVVRRCNVAKYSSMSDENCRRERVDGDAEEEEAEEAREEERSQLSVRTRFIAVRAVSAESAEKAGRSMVGPMATRRRHAASTSFAGGGTR